MVTGILVFTSFPDELVVDGVCWTSLYAGATTYTFRMIWRFAHINIHFTSVCTLAASDTFTAFNLNAEKGYLIK